MSAARVSLALLAFLPNIVFPYNIDTSQPNVYQDPDSSGSNYFGYSVSLSPGKNDASSRSLFVGAPNATAGQGRVYRCTEPKAGDRRTSGCQPLKLANPKGTTTGWLGASMATDEFSDLTVCGPRSLFRLRNDPSIESLGGTCYVVKDAIGNVLHADYGYELPKGHFNELHGFSVIYAERKNSGLNQSSTKITGQPGIQSVNIKQRSSRWNEWFNERDPHGQPHCYFGYSVSAGNYFGSKKLRIAVGAPAWSRKGMVVILGQHTIRSGRIKMEGSVPGEYFGASLATGDFDGDRHDDLAIGAPHWGDIDFGRVYTYHGNTYGMKLGRTLQGKVGNGQFGYTLAAADLDLDGYSDLIVSAPWENSGEGAVYVYYGHRNFRVGSPSDQIIQRIVPSAFGFDYRIQRFGFSLSRPVDIDGNGYPDLAIGAYKSGHAIVLRSRPVIETNINLITFPATLQASTENFIVSLCVTYKGEGAPASRDLSFNMTLDARHNRVENSSLEFDAVFFRDSRHCLNQTISLMKSRDYDVLDPIEISVTHGIRKGMSGNGIDAVLNRTSLNEKEPMAVSLNKGCEGGVCNAKLFVDASFEGVRKNNVWVVGSGDISLNVVVRNEEQLAYETRITIVMPPGIRLRKTVEFCTIVTDPLSLACEAGNPLVKGIPKRFKFDLDMSEIETRVVNASVLIFNVTKHTQSVDKEGGISTRILELKTKHLADVTVVGVTKTEYMDYSRISEKSKVSVRHAYQVLKFGPSRITEAYLDIDVPASIIGRDDSFLNITDPKLMDGSGKTYECFIDDSQSEDDVPQRSRREIYYDADDLRPHTSKTGDIGANLITERTVYLDCSTEGVSCFRLTCGFELSRTDEDVRYVVLDMTLDAGAFYTSDEDSLTVKFHTNASLVIRSPVISDSSTSRKWSARVMTMLYNNPEPKKVPVWVIPLSMFLGILLLCVLVVILSKVGFFNRSRKLEAARTRDPKLLLHIEDQEVEDEGGEPDASD